ncbi:amino acid adenylation domain-containing protein [Roseobacter sp.]|uniref:non-ribosomal peptide synthetase n=1 Tax=Roseobacter sp. TaxID=1907202 RepID=UPI003298DCE9
MVSLGDKLGTLSPAQRKLLLQRMAQKKQGVGRIPQRMSDGPAPLSFAQHRLWFMQTVAPETTAYNMATVLRLQGALDVGVMQSAFAQLCARHDTLRTRFDINTAGEPQQIIDATPQMAMMDVSTDNAPDAAAQDILDDIVAQPHRLDAPPVRAGLIRLGPDDHVVAIGLHHIAADRWSLGCMARELAVIYAALSQGRADPLPPLPIQMADFADWQHKTRATALDDQLAYWCTQLDGAPVLDLPRTPRRVADLGKGGGVHAFELPADLTATARAAAKQHGVSLFVLLLAGFNLLLSRYCDSDDIVLGSDVANRDRAETQGLVGPLVNTVVLRTDLKGAANFTQVLQRTAACFHAALAHQDVPLEHVIEALNPTRQPDEILPVFRAKFDLQQADRLPSQVHGLRLSRFPYAEGAAKYELRFNLEDDGTHLRCRVEYRADLYDPDVIARMARHFTTVLAAALADDTAPPAQLEMLSQDEHAALFTLAEGPAVPDHAPTLHRAFETQVDKTPDAPALTHGTTTLSYADLDARANAVAAAVSNTGLPPNARVGLCMHRTPNLIAAVFGILKAGYAYVPLDPAYPQARIDLIAQDADLTLVVTDGKTTAKFDHALDVTHASPAPRGPMRGAASDLAVVIYTSGTTGTPKGVMLEHRNILSRVAWAGQHFDAADLGGVLAATSVSFDLSLFEIFATLSHGGHLVLVQTLLDLPHLPAEASVTLVNTVPSLLRALVKHHDLPPTLRAINLAGEFFPPALLDHLQTLPHITKINNLYGPTEDAIYDAGNPVQHEPERPMPIGRPLPGSRIHIMDRHGALLPHGVAGELCVAGVGVARGYLNRPALTAEKFVPDPWHPGAMMYRSGDRGRWRADGRIDILGRLDTQIKIRGQRIEIGEIENTLERHDTVAEAIVVATSDAADPDRQIAAFIGVRAGQSVTQETLRGWLQTQLPAHMVPQLWSVMADLPRMPNGKIDRSALMVPGGTRTAKDPAATPTETHVIALWCEVLDNPEIGAQDDFFAAGGHSLMAMRLLVRLQDAFGITLSLGEMFDALTPRAQAALIDARLTETTDAPAPADATTGLTDAEVETLLSQMSS